MTDASWLAGDAAFARGQIWHRRSGPRPHAFRYRLYLSLLDLDRLDEVFARSRLWSLGRSNLVCFRRRDYLGPLHLGVAEAVRERVASFAGHRPQGRILLLTHLRQWGLCFNPVSFYLCLGSQGLEFIVAEIHNTPWNERHAYVLDCREQTGPNYRFQFSKRFHVSPFLPMDMDYDWRFRFEPDALHVHMAVTDRGSESFRAGMKLALEPMTTAAMRRMPLIFPLMTLRVVTGIYWQALRLWLKRTPFYTHPDKEPEVS